MERRDLLPRFELSLRVQSLRYLLGEVINPRAR